MRIFLAVALTTFACASWAEDASAKLIAQLQAIDSLKGDYSQTITDKKGALVQKTQGDFVIKRPGYFYWASKGTQEQKVIGNPQKLWVYDPDLEQVTVRKNPGESDNSPARLLSGDVAKMAPLFKVSEKITGAQQEFTLVPKKRDKEQLNQIQFIFTSGSLSAMAFEDKLGQTTQLNLVNTATNQPVDMSLFTFVPKPGIDVIEND
ncbi:MAG TPA: outer membrane lipoprotein chaperone LolA [Cellvibrionaceae bacterium]